MNADGLFCGLTLPMQLDSDTGVIVSRMPVAQGGATLLKSKCCCQLKIRMTGSGKHPFTPPEEEDQCAVWDQLPVPPIQYRLPTPQGAERMTSTTGSEPSMAKTT